MSTAIYTIRDIFNLSLHQNLFFALFSSNLLPEFHRLKLITSAARQKILKSFLNIRYPSGSFKLAIWLRVYKQVTYECVVAL